MNTAGCGSARVCKRIEKNHVGQERLGPKLELEAHAKRKNHPDAPALGWHGGAIICSNETGLAEVRNHFHKVEHHGKSRRRTSVSTRWAFGRVEHSAPSCLCPGLQRGSQPGSRGN